MISILTGRRLRLDLLTHRPPVARGIRTLLAASAAIVILSCLVAVLGASPLSVAAALIYGSVGAPYSLGQTVMVASILSLTGIAAAVPFTARMFNLGAEGQLYAGALAATAVGLELSDHVGRPLLLLTLTAAGALAGALWAAIPGLMKAWTDANEVIVSMMLTFVAALFVEYATVGIWPSGLAQNSRALPGKALLPTLSSSTGITLGVILALGTVATAWLLMSRSTVGFQIRVTGHNTETARLCGIPVRRIQLASFVLGGAAAGLAGSILVAGIDNDLISGGAAGLGFLGVAVALVARLSPAWIPLSAAAFAALRVGGNALQVKAGLSSTTGEVVIGVFMLTLLAFGAIGLRGGR